MMQPINSTDVNQVLVQDPRQLLPEQQTESDRAATEVTLIYLWGSATAATASAIIQNMSGIEGMKPGEHSESKNPRILAPRPGIEPTAPAVERRLLTTGPPRKSGQGPHALAHRVCTSTGESALELN